jgi:cytidine deaminase
MSSLPSIRVPENAEVLDEEDRAFISSTQALKDRSARPIHSQFLVAATVVYVDSHGTQRSVEGVNSETCVLSSCICAERTALVQLRLAATGWRFVRKVYITATCTALITPGLLCREFLSEFSEASCAVRERHEGSALAPPANPCGDIDIVLFNDSGNFKKHSLAALYPHPPLYHGVPNAMLESAGESFPREPVSLLTLQSAGAGLDAALLPAAEGLCRAVTRLASEAHEMDELYPIHLAAGALFADGETSLARQLKGLEYGCSADAVVRLSGCFKKGRAVALIVQSDQYGNLIAPSAPARSLLTEHCERLGLSSAHVLLHTAPGGSGAAKLAALSIAALASDAPEIKTGLRAALSPKSQGGSSSPGSFTGGAGKPF